MHGSKPLHSETLEYEGMVPLECTLLKTLVNGRGGGIRTPDPLVPNQMRYQTALRPDVL